MKAANNRWLSEVKVSFLPKFSRSNTGKVHPIPQTGEWDFYFLDKGGEKR